MRVTENELLAQGITHIGNVEAALLVGNLGVKDDVQQHIAKFLAYILHIVAHQGIAQLHHLFYGVRAQAFICLLCVPRTFHAQFIEHIEQFAECLKTRLTVICHCFVFFH